MIPLEDFFRKPDKIALRLSPDGKSLAWLEPWDRRLNLTVRDLVDGTTRRVTEARERDLGGYVWVSNERLVYVQDSGGDENFRLYAVGRDGTNPIDLTPFDGVKCDIVDDLEEDDDHILFQMNKRDPQVFDVYRLNVHDGAMELVGENPGNIQTWFTDHDGKLRLATTTDGVNTSLLFRDTESDSWRTVATYDFKEYARPQLFTFDNRGVYVASNLGRDKLAIAEYDIATGRETNLLFEHDEVDVDTLLFSRRRKCLTGVTFEVDRLGYHFFDETRAELQAFVDGRLPGRENAVVSHSRDENHYIVRSGSDRTLGEYHLLDAAARTLTKLFEISPWIEEARMAETRPIRYTARDGLAIHGYLTLPPGAEPSALPLVVHPHGGPWARDRWGFDPELQFLASRGYAVLQVNFRSSAGFGRAFLEAGFREWGLAMQDDITDGVRWAIDEGLADPARVAIYGGSYGGYATLAGLTKTPELYACGISYVGVSNLFTWIEAIPPYWKPYLEMIYEMVGHPERDRERFEATSPFFNAESIVAPLFVAQGANDPRVPKQESDQIVEALRSRGVEVTYMVKDNEGHGFLNEENRFDFYREMERFLGRWLAAGDTR
ncbi:MAG: prolyl oligopeptidase family serine peptidase [Acidobacteria bacterium]|nr:prolyl oligopeptidase family serine peptidase [Acidobacteriota bacterium]NIM61369.1 prolyl oligopeptidase family serine peptidase [Acidobacteriota bacterium]NIO58804.1 prolyl oligopeptidase family serine peptidase [Acidobacteriota bacterium]NIQ29848.1 prolyl oligopeptidase family serine peptidase [Acidobacteriota bacterium]NIQ84581.1 prolyl oligopeptidase family serine peptidase [Acidobacteriota bacterium]